VPLQMINSVNKQGSLSGGGMVTVLLKDFRTIRLAMPRPEIYAALSQIAFVETHEQYFAFARERIGGSEGWRVYTPEAEWQRQFSRCSTASNWRPCPNADYSLCNTYPKLLVVPSSVTNETIINAASFRSRGRFPTLSHLHTNGRAITRAAQPLVGIKGAVHVTEKKKRNRLHLNLRSPIAQRRGVGRGHSRVRFAIGFAVHSGRSSQSQRGSKPGHGQSECSLLPTVVQL
jgi:hypothetical protein